MKFYKQLDGLRAVAVFAVMISHGIFLPVVQQLSLGYVGVNLFFVLSGFLITEGLFKSINQPHKKSTLLNIFYLKRILRIFPVYYLVVFFAFIADYDNGRNLLFYNLPYTLNIYNAFTDNIGHGLSHIWSLCVEEQFYLVWPLVLVFSNPKKHLLIILLTIISALVIRAIVASSNFPYANTFNYRMMPACMDAFGIGSLLAYLKLYKTSQLQILLRKLWIPVLAMIVFGLAIFNVFSSTLFAEVMNRFSISIISFFLIGYGIFGSKNLWGKMLEHTVFQYLGKISYGIYLYHLLIISYLDPIFGAYWDSVAQQLPEVLRYNGYLVSFPIYILLTVMLASISYYLVEKPFLSLKSKLSRKRIPKEEELILQPRIILLGDHNRITRDI